MSKAEFVAVLKMALENEDLQKKIVALAKDEGYDFEVGELTEEELDEAAGGLTWSSILSSMTMKVDSSLTTSMKVEEPLLDQHKIDF